ncbi:MAG: chromosomal replication initiator protein DnaA [Sedimentisphaerales bacterium]|nr:chromosomal replication initiator protein DnaA [Sedimentisphaerales bacterium]
MAAQEADNIFAGLLERVRSLDPANARKWFDNLTVLYLDRGSLGVGCPDEATVQFLRDNCRKSFTQAAQQITGHLVTVDFHACPLGPARGGPEPGRGIDSHTESSSRKGQQSGLILHPDYTFDNFVVGPSNRLAHASCVAVSQSLGSTYNPLFLYGSSGLGKTHLLHAVCCEAQQKFDGIVIQLLSCEDFVNRFIRAIEEGNLASFQSQFRTVDALVIDDVQFLSEREQSQEEFFHTFNALYHNGKQIILSADRPPAEIPSLEARLISRFNWGLVARIDPPAYETRVAIVQKKANLRGISISDEVAEYIATKVHANIRELEGALTTIYALAMSEARNTRDEVRGTSIVPPPARGQARPRESGDPSSIVSLELAQKALEGQIHLADKHINIIDIIEVVTRHFGVRLSDLQSKKRSQSVTFPRQICMYLARNLTKHSLEEIGGHLGGRDHTTVKHACSKIAEAKESDPKMQALLNELTRQVTQSPQTS